MARSTLFGYTIEEDEGKLVITVEGPFAAEATRSLRTCLQQGRGLSLLSRLSPLAPLGRLMSAAVDITGTEGATSERAPEARLEMRNPRLDLQKIFSQGIDQDLDAFSQQLETFRDALEAQEESPTMDLPSIPEEDARPEPKDEAGTTRSKRGAKSAARQAE